MIQFLLTQIAKIKSGLNNANKSVSIENVTNLINYTAASYVEYISSQNIKIHITSCNTAGRLSDLPIQQAGTYIVIPGTYFFQIIFIGADGAVYFYKADSKEWIALQV